MNMNMIIVNLLSLLFKLADVLIIILPVLLSVAFMNMNPILEAISICFYLSNKFEKKSNKKLFKLIQKIKIKRFKFKLNLLTLSLAISIALLLFFILAAVFLSDIYISLSILDTFIISLFKNVSLLTKGLDF
jgi:hypothetical protein